MRDIGFGLGMTAAGMGTVFAMLLLLMIIVSLMGRMDRQPSSAENAGRDGLAGEDLDAMSGIDDAPDTAPRVLADGLTEDQIAAVSVAVLLHAEIRRQQAAPAMRTHQPGSHIFASRWVANGRGLQTQPWRRS
ncbi:OadG family protein [Nostocoides australiense]|nr:OadG family protein [Tetrasphaera australiensis]